MKNILLISLLVVLLSGCAASNIQSARLDNTKPLPENHGIVAVQVVNNTGRLAPLHAGWTEVLAVRLDNRDAIKDAAFAAAREKAKAKNKVFDPDKVDWSPEIYSMTPITEGVIDSQLFAGSMPAGNYVISSLYSFYSDGNISSWITMPVGFSAGTYNVEAGRFTNLGSLVFQPLLNVKNESFWSNSSSQKAYVARIDELENLDLFIKGHYPQVVKTVDFSQPIQWESDEPELADYRSVLSTLSRTNAYGANAMQTGIDGTRAIAAKFGQLRVVDSQGKWQQVNLSTNSQIAAVVNTNEKILIGGERGQVFEGDSFDGEWTLTQPVAPTEAVVWFGQGKNALYALTSSARAFQLYEVNGSDGWKRIGDFVKKIANDFFVQNGGLFPVITAQGTVRVINDNKIYDYDVASGQWLQTKGKALVDMTQLSTGVILGIEVSQWDGAGDQVISYDDGSTWLTVDRRLSLFGDTVTERALPILLDDGTVVTLGRESKGGKGLKLISQPKSNLGDKKAWLAHGDAKANCETSLPELTQGNTIYFLCDKGEVVSTSDLGLTWETAVDINVAAMQSEYDDFMAELKKKLEAEKAQKALAEKQAQEQAQQAETGEQL